MKQLFSGPALATFAAAAVMNVSAALAAQTSITVGMQLEPPNLDPTGGAAAAIDEVVYANVFEGLTRYQADGSVASALAKSWTISDDGLVYTFSLHSGVKFHDGSAMDAEDVKFSLDRARAEDSTNAQKRLFTGIASVDAVDALTVKITLSNPDGGFITNLAWGDAVIVAPESIENAKTAPVGTGPFTFSRWVQGDRVELAGYPAPETLPQFEADPRFRVIVGSTEGETILSTNNKAENLSDVRIRQAIAHAIDRQAIIDGAMFGYGTPIGTHFAPHHPDYVDLTGGSAHDPAKARALLKEAGAENLTLSLKLPPPSYARRGGEIIAAQLREVGIGTEIENLEWAQWLEQVFRGKDFDLTIVSHTEPMDIGIYANPDYYFQYDSAAFQGLIDDLKLATAPADRTRILQAAQKQIAGDYVNGYLFQLARTGVANARINGLWENAPTQANDLTGVSWSN